MAGNLYKNWGAEQRAHWNAYNKKYAKSHFKTITLKLRFNEDQDILNYLETNRTKSVSEIVREGIRKLIETK